MGFFASSGILNRRGFFGGVAPTAPFSPANITGLALWLKADAGVTLSGSSVTEWADQSGQGKTATGVTDEEPTIITNALNGKTGIQFNGAQTMVTNSILTLGYNTPVTIIGVAEASANDVKSGDVARWFITIGNNNDLAEGLTFGPYGGTPAFGGLIGGAGIGDTDILYSDMGENEAGLAVAINDGINFNYYHNGELIDSQEIIWTETTAVNSFSIATQKYEGSHIFYSNCVIYELIVYDSALSAQDRQAVETYLNDKYAIY